MSLKGGLAAALVMLGCAGRSDISGDGHLAPDATGGEIQDGGFDTAADGGPLDLCDPAGVHLCGEGCPWLATPDAATPADASGICPGYGCLSPEDTLSFAPVAEAGVCWAESEATAKYLCGTCNDGEVCVQRSPSELVCVAEDVCRALWTLGVRDVCRYADFRPYDGRALPEATASCPIITGATGPQVICAATCPPCPNSERCVGRSPDHPFGLCNNQLLGLGDPQPSDFQTCGACFASLPPTADWVCAVFDTAPADEAAARAGGFCMPRKDCLTASAALPGGASCFDRSGVRVGP